MSKSDIHTDDTPSYEVALTYAQNAAKQAQRSIDQFAGSNLGMPYNAAKLAQYERELKGCNVVVAIITNLINSNK